MMVRIDFSALGTANSSRVRLGRAPGGTLVRVEELSETPRGYTVTVDSNGDGNLADERSYTLSADSSVEVLVKRRWNDKEAFLPYIIALESRPDANGKLTQAFSWRPKYRAEGKLRINGCETLFVVLDFNGDGIFDERDFARGTTLGLDRNGDGRIWGGDEWFGAKQIIEYCGASLLIENVEPDVPTGSIPAPARPVAR